MGTTVNFGKDTLHGGKKMHTYFDNFGHSTFNQTRTTKVTMSAGTLVPTYYNIGTKGDSFDINIESIIKTKPTINPLFGTFKMQTDFFICPVRLYNGLLHMNDTNIGLKMNQVFFPQLEMTTSFGWDKLSNSSIMTMFDLRGFASSAAEYMTQEPNQWQNLRTFKYNALFILMYLDCFKNYYANRQEENFYYIAKGEIEPQQSFERNNFATPTIEEITIIRANPIPGEYENVTIPWNADEWVAPIQIYPNDTIIIKGKKLKAEDITIINNHISISQNGGNEWYYIESENIILIKPTQQIELLDPQTAGEFQPHLADKRGPTKLKSIPLSALDQLRIDILKFTQKGTPMVFNGQGQEEYNKYFEDICQADYGANQVYGNKCCNEQQGLIVKTYQNDMFNNWLRTEYIEEISEMTAIKVEMGKVKIDDIILQRKIYDMMNRVAVSGGSLQDWEQARYGGKEKRWIESPMYIGGFSAEIGFDEVVSTAETSQTNGDNSETTPLGSLAGKGGMIAKSDQGGNIHVTLDETCVILGITSITPRVDYCQGNNWMLTELVTMDNLHAPELDQIGFEDLLQREMAYFTNIPNSTEQLAAGKNPAWIHYMTDIDKVYGDFCDIDKMGSMVLLRDYEEDEFNPGNIKDLTTYIDPVKFNYAFADTDYDAMNFLVQLKFNVDSRRVMSAKIMPNL